MKNSLRFTAVVLLGSLLAACSSEDPENGKLPEPTPIVVRSGLEGKIAQDNAFAFDLLRTAESFADGDNIVLSPLSISMALGMTVNGTVGDTRDEMLEALRSSGYTLDDLNEYAKTLREGLLATDPSTELGIANSIWYRKGLPVKSDFINVNWLNYAAEVAESDFADPKTVNVINNWVSGHTNKRIPTVIDQISPEMVIYLINAVYFKGIWASKFDKAKTTQKLFTAADGAVSQVPTMIQTETFGYHADETAAYLEMLYGNGAFGMVVMLPNEGKTTDDLLKNLDSESWNTVIEAMRPCEAEVHLPRFKFEQSFNLHEKILPGMGMNLAFNPQKADFSNMAVIDGQNIFISMVLHKTFIEVNEEGTEAAAVTVVGGEATSAGPDPQPVSFIVDRPFAFAIREQSTGAILFIGKVGKID